jgi:hypothetical protein
MTYAQRIVILQIDSLQFCMTMKNLQLLFILLIISTLACQSEKKEKAEKNTGTEEYQAPSFIINPRTIAGYERPLVGKWSTAFRDVKGNLVIPRQTEGSYLEFKNDGTYRLFREDKAIRVGLWTVNATTKILEMKTEKNNKHYLLTNTGGGLIEMTEQDRGHKLVYVPYSR